MPARTLRSEKMLDTVKDIVHFGNCLHIRSPVDHPVHVSFTLELRRCHEIQYKMVTVSSNDISQMC